MLNEYARQCSRVFAGVFKKKKIKGRLAGNVRRSSRFITFPIELQDPTQIERAMKTADAIALGCRSSAVICRVERGMLEFDVTLHKRHWKGYEAQNIGPRAVGITASGKEMRYEFSMASLLVAGVPNAGKSETIKTILYKVVTNTRPENVQLHIIDPHGSMSKFERVPHLKFPVASMGDEPEFIIDYVYKQLHRRRGEGEVALRERNAQGILLVIDEINADNVLGTTSKNKEVARKLEHIVRQGRKFRINVILGTQKPKDNAIVDLVPHRIVGNVADAHSAARLTGMAGTNAHLLTGQGDMIYVFGNNMERFQTALVTDWSGLPERVEPLEPFPQEEDEDCDSYDSDAGRPATELEEWIIEEYVDNPPSIREAKERYGHGRHIHNRYKKAAKERA